MLSPLSRICKKGKSSVEDQRRRIQEVFSDIDNGRLDKSIAGQELAYLREIDVGGYDTALGQDSDLTANAKDFGGPYPSSWVKEHEPESFWKTLFKNMWSFFRRH